MEIKTKHILLGIGDYELKLPLSVNFQPILVSIFFDTYDKYELVSDKIYRIKQLQQVYNIVFDALKMPRRDIYTEKYNEIETFDYKNRGKNHRKIRYVHEFVHHSKSHYTLYILTPLRYAVIFWEQYKNIYGTHRADEMDDDNTYNLIHHFNDCYRYLVEQKVFGKKRDYIHLSTTTVDNLISSLIIE